MTHEQKTKFKKRIKKILSIALACHVIYAMIVSYQLKKEILEEIHSIELFNETYDQLIDRFNDNHYQITNINDKSYPGFVATKGNMVFEYHEQQTVNSYRFEYTTKDITPLFNNIEWHDRYLTVKNKLHLTFFYLIFSPSGVRIYDDLIDIHYDDYLILIGFDDKKELDVIDILVMK